MESSEVWAQRATRAYDLWGQALNAQIEHLNEANADLPADKQLSLKDPMLRANNECIDRARYLFELSMQNHDYMAELESAGARLAEPKPEPEVPQTKPKPRRPKPEAPKWKAFTRSDEEIADYTQTILDEMRDRLDAIHTEHTPQQVAEKQSRGWLGKTTSIFIKKGDEDFKMTVNNRDIAALDEMMQVVMWVGQANGPRQAARKRTPNDRMRFVAELVNLAKPENEDRLDAGQIWELVDMAEEGGLIKGAETDDPKITVKGLREVRSIFEGINDQRVEKPFVGYSPSS